MGEARAVMSTGFVSAACGVSCLLLVACNSAPAESAGSRQPGAEIPSTSPFAEPHAVAAVGGAGAPASAPANAPLPTQRANEMSSASAPRKASTPTPPSGVPQGPAAPITEQPQHIVRIVPTDSRIVQQPLRPALPISGGTLLASSDGRYAVLSDPERDSVSIVDLLFQRLVSTIALQAGDEPGRLVQDATGRVHVALRRGGAVVSIDLTSFSVVARRAVCAAPRGIAYDAASQQLRVACASGELVSLPAASGEATARTRLASDLRDVVVRPDAVFVSRLKSAQLLRLDAAQTAVAATERPQTPRLLFPEPDGTQVVDTLEPELARRTIGTRNGGFVMLHQGARNGEIQLQSATDSGSSGSPYGADGSCTGVVGTEITRFDNAGHVLTTSQLSDVLVVDVAEAPDSGELAVAVAGTRDPAQPFVSLEVEGSQEMGPNQPTAGGTAVTETNAVQVFDPAQLDQSKTMGFTGCTPPIRTYPLPGQATAVAYLSDSRLLIQSREPSTLWIFPSPNDQSGAASVKIDLGGLSVYDSGHEIFHRDAGAGVACASCHVEGSDDGHVWHFVDQGARRTQSLDVGLEGTAPFHWVGDMNNIGTLMEQVFVGRMGGVHQSDARRGALEQWLYSIKAPTPIRAANDAVVMRGHALFEGAAKCSTCHAGAKLTNNMTVDVGTGLSLQVPSLIGIGYRGPFLHTGCAATLRDRFDPACGGNKHGDVSELTSDQIDDLVGYLEAL